MKTNDAALSENTVNTQIGAIACRIAARMLAGEQEDNARRAELAVSGLAPLKGQAAWNTALQIVRRISGGPAISDAHCGALPDLAR